MPAPIHRTGSIEIAGNLIPARQIGGDLYDVLPSGNDTVALVADVAGKGVAASLLTASVHAAAAHAVSTEGADPSAIVSAIEREIGPLLDRTGRIVTVAVAATDVSAGSVRIASAGHHPVVARTSGGAELVLPGAPPLGIGSFRAVETALPGTPGTVVVLASDGIVDQRRSSGEAYGIDRLLAAVERLAAAPAADGVDALFADVAEFAEGAIQDDDQTALVMRVVEAGV
jgi:serine phosphatase RsbU (regulator of sigma subunit)